MAAKTGERKWLAWVVCLLCPNHRSAAGSTIFLDDVYVRTQMRVCLTTATVLDCLEAFALRWPSRYPALVDMRVLFDGRTLEHSLTLADNGVEDGDVVEVRQTQVGC